MRRFHGRSITDVAREYELPYTTVERWYYLYTADELTEEIATTICVDEFALRKGHRYATSVLNADTGRILAIVPRRNQDAITTVLQKVTGPIRAVVSDFAPAMANDSCAGSLSSRAIFYRCPAAKTTLFRRSQKTS